jgi:hypothetical protein
MSSVDAINSTATSWGVTGAKSTSKSTSSASDDFAKIVNNLKSGKAANSSNDDDNKDTVTITKVLSDGSVLITVMKGDQIVSETKTSSAKPDEKAKVLSETKSGDMDSDTKAAALDPTKTGMLAQTLDKFNATSTSITEGSLFSADI